MTIVMTGSFTSASVKLSARISASADHSLSSSARDARRPDPPSLNESSFRRSRRRSTPAPCTSSDSRSSERYGTIVRLRYVARGMSSGSVKSFDTTNTPSPSTLKYDAPSGAGAAPPSANRYTSLPIVMVPDARGASNVGAAFGSTLRTNVANSRADVSCSTALGSATSGGSSSRHDASASRSTSRTSTSFSLPLSISMRESSSRRNAARRFLGRIARSVSVTDARSIQIHTASATAEATSTIDVVCLRHVIRPRLSRVGASCPPCCAFVRRRAPRA